MNPQKLLVITGQTATGKTAIASMVAKQFSGEIISADSRQIYQGMTVLTGEDLEGASIDHSRDIDVMIDGTQVTLAPKVLDGISYWLTDFVAPDTIFTVASYCICARAVIASIARRKSIPILVGGTGLYIRALIDPSYTFTALPDAAFRKEVSGWSLDMLQEKVRLTLPHLWETMNESDRKNPRRLIRAIERSMDNFGTSPVSDTTDRYDVCTIVLTKEIGLYEKIDQRVDDRIHTGAMMEISALYDRWQDQRLPSLSATGYKRFFDPKSRVAGTPEYVEAVKQWKFDEHGYARRQKTWSKKYTEGVSFDAGDEDLTNKIAEHVAQWYTGKKI
jgi:tRNA dimethylallyltransferase